jgi:acetyl esterase/lipase
MVIGVCHEMAKRKEYGHIKLCVPHIAAMSPVWLDHKPDSEELTWVQQMNYVNHLDIYRKLMAANDKQFTSKDPDLFPGNMKATHLKMCPPMYLTTAEWDHYKLDNDWFKERLQKHKLLLGYFVEPGQMHGPMPHKELSKIFQHYL